MYELNINAGVTGVDQVERLGAATDKQTERTKRVDDAIKNYTASNDKLAIKLLEIEKNEVRLEQLREQHRMQTDRLAAATNNHTAAQERLNSSMKHAVTDVQAASASIRAMEGHLPIRAVEQFTTKMLGMGGAFQMAFPIVGAIALIEALDKGLEKLGIQLAFWKQIEEAQKQSTEELKRAGREYDTLLGKLETLQRQERRRSLIAANPKTGGILADNADAFDIQFQAGTTDRQRVQLLERQLTAVRNVTTYGHKPTAEEAMYATLAGVKHVDAGVYMDDVTMRAGRTAIAPIEKELANARLEVELGLAKAKELGAAADEKAEKNREEGARKVAAIEEHILTIRLKAQEAAMRAYFGNSLEGKAAYDQVRLRMEESDAVRKYGPGVRGSYTVLRAAAFNENAAAIAKRNMDEGFGLDDVSTSSLAKLIRNDLAGERHDMPELQALIRPGQPAPPPGYRSPGQELRDARDSERRYMGVARVSAQLSGQSERDQIESAYAARIRFADQELHALLRIADAKNDLIAREDALDQAQQKRYDAALEREKAILEMILRQKQEFEKNFVGLVHAITSGHLGDFVVKRLESLGDEILMKMGGKIFDAIFKAGAPKTISIRDALGGAAKDPIDVQATNQNTVATDDNTRALRDLTSILLMGGGGGGGTIGFPNGSGGPGVMGGANSTIMYGVPPGLGGGQAMSGNARLGMGIMGGGLLYSGIQRGGAQGDLAAAGGAAMLVGAVLPMISKSLAAAGPIGAAVGGALEMISLVAGMFGPSPQSRQREISNKLEFARFLDPVSIHASMTTQGGYADFDRYGGIRGSDLSPFPVIEQAYRDHFHQTTVPGRTVSQFGGRPVNITIHALDARSVLDRHADIADAVVRAIDHGHTPLQEKLRSF